MTEIAAEINRRLDDLVRQEDAIICMARENPDAQPLVFSEEFAKLYRLQKRLVSYILDAAELGSPIRPGEQP